MTETNTKTPLVILPLIIFAISTNAHAYSNVPCIDKPGYYARVDGGKSSPIRVKVWILDASNINYQKTLDNLISNAYYNRSDYYAMCINGAYGTGAYSSYSNLTCTNKYGHTTTENEHTLNIVGNYFYIPIQSGLTVKLDPKESVTKTWTYCNLGAQAIFNIGLLNTKSGYVTDKRFFSITTYSTPMEVRINEPTPNNYKF